METKLKYAQGELANKLNLARKSKGLSIRKLSREAETSSSQIQRVLNGSDHSMTLRTLFRVAKALDLEIDISLKEIQ